MDTSRERAAGPHGLTSVPSVEELVRAAAQAGFGLVGLDKYSLDALGVAPGETARSLRLEALRCFEMLGVSVDGDDGTSLAMARAVARWVGETVAEWVLTVAGAPVDDALIDRFSRCADVIVAEGARMSLPDDTELLDELATVHLRETAPGQYRVDHEPGRHDDRVIALGLAVAAVLDTPPTYRARVFAPTRGTPTRATSACA